MRHPWILPGLIFTALTFAQPAMAQERERSSRSHRHILAGPWEMPDWVVDENTRRLLEEMMRSARGGGPQGELTPRERERLLQQVRKMLEQMPPGGTLPNPDALKGLEGYEDLLESYRRMLADAQRPPGDPTLEDTFQEWMGDLARELREEAGAGPLFDTDPGNQPPILSPEGAKLMRDLLQDVKVDPKLREELNRSFRGVKDALKGLRDWWKEMPKPERNGGDKTDPAKTDPIRSPTDPATNPSSSHLRAPTLPALPAVPDLPIREFLLVVLYAGAAALAMFVLYLLWGLLGERVRASLARSRIRRPELPERFGGPDEYFRFFRELMAYLTRRPVEGRTHRELEDGAVAIHPASEQASRAAARAYETLYYDRRAQARADEMCRQAHEACRDLLDQVRD